MSAAIASKSCLFLAIRITSAPREANARAFPYATRCPCHDCDRTITLHRSVPSICFNSHVTRPALVATQEVLHSLSEQGSFNATFASPIAAPKYLADQQWIVAKRASMGRISH